MMKNTFGRTMKKDGHIRMITTKSSMNEVYADVISDLRVNGRLVNATVELLNYQVTLTDPTQLDITHPSRKWSSDYAFAELAFYLGGNRSVGNMDKLAKIWGLISDKNGEVESNYGNHIFSHAFDSNDNMWYSARDELDSNPNSRRAVIPILEKDHIRKNDKDYPCTGFIQFLIRDNKLHLNWNMRSCDAIFGLCNDMFCAAMLQQLMLNELNLLGSAGFNLALGDLTFNLGSLHIYSRHWNLLYADLSEWKSYRGKRYIIKGEITPFSGMRQEYGLKPCDSVEDIKEKAKRFKRNLTVGGDFDG